MYFCHTQMHDNFLPSILQLSTFPCRKLEVIVLSRCHWMLSQEKVLSFLIVSCQAIRSPFIWSITINIGPEDTAIAPFLTQNVNKETEEPSREAHAMENFHDPFQYYQWICPSIWLREKNIKSFEENIFEKKNLNK